MRKKPGAVKYFCPKCEERAVELSHTAAESVAWCGRCGYAYVVERPEPEPGPVGV